MYLIIFRLIKNIPDFPSLLLHYFIGNNWVLEKPRKVSNENVRSGCTVSSTRWSHCLFNVSTNCAFFLIMILTACGLDEVMGVCFTWYNCINLVAFYCLKSVHHVNLSGVFHMRIRFLFILQCCCKTKLCETRNW